MRFRAQTSRSPYLNRAHQRRLLMMIGLLVLVVVGIRVAANPNTWNWLFAFQGKQNSQSESDRNSDRRGSDQPLRPAPLKPDEVRARTVEPKDAESKTQTPDGEVLPEAPAVDSGVGVGPQALGKLKDRKGVEFDELDAYYALLSRAAKTSSRDLRRDARRDVGYTMLMDGPGDYRGVAVLLEGRLGSLKQLPSTRDGLGTLYEAWIVTPASGRDPYRVVFSELPDDLEPADRFEKPPNVRTVGYFFKVERYSVDDERDHDAPLLLAKRVERIPDAELQSPGLGFAPYVIGFALLMGGVLALTMWRFSVGDRKFARERLSRMEEQRDRDAAGLNELPAADDADEFFKRLSENADAEEGPAS